MLSKLLRILIPLVACAALFATPGHAQCPSQTPNVGLQVPNLGNTTYWGTCINADLNMLDTLLGGVTTLSAGTTPAVNPAGNPTTNYVTANTAGTTITNFLNGFTGQTIRVICGAADSYTSIVSSSGISVNGTFSCPAGKALTLTLIGGVWQETARGTGGGGGSMIYPGAGVPNSLGYAWGTSYGVGAAANDLVQLNGSGKLPAVDGSQLTNLPGGLSFPGAGVPNSTGSAWGTSYAVGTAANDLVQLNGSDKLPALDGSLLVNLPSGSSGWGASANAYQYISSGGNDSNNGLSLAAAKATLSAAFTWCSSNASSGCLIYWLPGSYTISAGLTPPSNVTIVLSPNVTVNASGVPSGTPLFALSGSNIAIIGDPGKTDVINEAQSGFTAVGDCFRISGSYLTIQNLTVEGCQEDGFYVIGASYLKIFDNIVSANGRNGLSVTDGLTHAWIERNIFENSAISAPFDGIDIEPNLSTDLLEDVNLVDNIEQNNGISNAGCTSTGAACYGLQFSLQNYTSSTPPITVNVVRNHTISNLEDGIELNGGTASNGTINIDDSDSRLDSCRGIEAKFWSTADNQVMVHNFRFYDPMQNSSNCQYSSNSAGIGVLEGGGATLPEGNLFFYNTSGQITDSKTAYYFAIADGSSVGYANILFDTAGVRSGAGSGDEYILGAAASFTPTISSGFGTSPSIVHNNGADGIARQVSLEVNVGTGGSATTGVVALPASLLGNGWNCSAQDVNTNIVTRETAFSTTSVTLTAASAWTASDKLLVNCGAF